MSRLRVLHIALNAPNEPNGGIEKGFKKNDIAYCQIDWIAFKGQHGIESLQKNIIETVNEFKPNLIFMQLQTAGLLSIGTAQEITKKAFVVNWTGDVRENIEWYKLLAPHINLTLFTNTTDVRLMNEAGFKNVDYLQIGYDQDIYQKLSSKAPYPPIVFLGNNYYGVQMRFPLSKERVDMVEFLKKEFGSKFGVYGGAWNGTKKLYPNEEVICYNSCKIAINQNHFDYERFSSDRILRIMASGAMCLSKYYKGIELEFVIGEHLDVWHDFNELKEKINYYLAHEEKRNEIADAGMQLVSTSYNWCERFKQLLAVSKKYDMTNKLSTDNNWIYDIPTVTKFRKYSQDDEEGYIGYILNNIGNHNHFLVDLGAAKYISNTKFFLEIGYTGILLDANNCGEQNIHEEWITRENIIELLEKYNCPKEFDLLSIDLDGNDYYILDAVLKAYYPRLIVCEINPIFPIESAMAIEYNPLYAWAEDDYYGMSMGAILKLADNHNYSVVYQGGGLNAYLVRNDLINGGINIDLGFKVSHPHKHNNYSKWVQI